MAISVLRESRNDCNLVTIIIGDQYLHNWNSLVNTSWIKYADRFNLGIIITGGLIPQDHPYWKKATWQKLLIPKALINSQIHCKFVSYIDSDIVINPFAPNIFESALPHKVGVVSIRQNMPYEFQAINRRLAYLRRKFIDESDPLNSAQHFSTKELYNYYGYDDQGDEFCAGILLFDPSKISKAFEDWFYLYKSDVKSITDGGEQTHLNFHIFSSNLANPLPYQFQAIWAYEIAWHHSNLFEEQFANRENLRKAFSQILLNNYSVHFAGKQPETSFAFVDSVLDVPHYIDSWNDLDMYNKSVITPRPMR